MTANLAEQIMKILLAAAQSCPKTKAVFPALKKEV